MTNANGSITVRIDPDAHVEDVKWLFKEWLPLIAEIFEAGAGPSPEEDPTLEVLEGLDVHVFARTEKRDDWEEGTVTPGFLTFMTASSGFSMGFSTTHFRAPDGTAHDTEEGSKISDAYWALLG